MIRQDYYSGHAIGRSPVETTLKEEKLRMARPRQWRRVASSSNIAWLAARILCAVITVVCFPGKPKALQDGAATVIRDRYGVPHIFAGREEAGMYAFGFCQAQDRLEAVLRNYKQARGELSELDGEVALTTDINVRAYRLQEIAAEKYNSLPYQIRANLTAFCAGVNAFQKKYPARRPSWAFEVSPTDVVAFAAFLNLAFAVDPSEHGLESVRVAGIGLRGTETGAEYGSNAFAVGPTKMASGRGTILSADPHLPWSGFLRWYEAHLVCGPLNVSGVTFVGLPLIAVGHNGHVAWANTVNQPDLSDIYEERLTPESNPVSYEYNGVKRPLIQRSFKFRVRQDDGSLVEEKRTVGYTHHGPLIINQGTHHYAVRKAGWGDIDMFSQLRSQCLAKTAAEYRQALQGQHVVSFNHVFADDHGHIGYVWAGRIPRRPSGYDFSGPVPGWTAKTEWSPPVPLQALPHLNDPPTGFVQNCNDGPSKVTPGAQLTPPMPSAGYPFWLAPDGVTNRGSRMSQLLSQERTMTVPVAQSIACDVLELRAQRELQPLLAALRVATPTNDQSNLQRQCLTVLSRWNGQCTADARGAALFLEWAAQPDVRGLLGASTSASAPIAVQDPALAVRCLLSAAQSLAARQMSPEVPLSEVLRHRRGSVDLTIDGGGDSLTPLRSALGPDGKRVAYSGPSFRMIVELGNGPVRSWTYVPYGNSDDPASPHYTDQMELAARRQYRRSPFTRREVESEATERVELTYLVPPLAVKKAVARGRAVP